MPIPAHEHPIQNLEPPDEVEIDLECPECGREMEPQGCGEWKCEWPFCDSNSLDPEDEYASLECKLHESQRKGNRAIAMLRNLVRAIRKEKIFGTDYFNARLGDAQIFLNGIR